MDHSIVPAALLTALALAREHKGAREALRRTGLDLDGVERVDGLSQDLGVLLNGHTAEEALGEALALGFLAGRIAHRPRPQRSLCPSSFLLDEDLMLRFAEGESILRLPWVEDGLFVGRKLPDISEIPATIRDLAVEHYRAGLAGTRGRFAFESYGHGFTVDVLPVRGDNGHINAVLGVAVPTRELISPTSSAEALDQVAEALRDAATLADVRAERHRVAGQPDAAARERQAAETAREAARRADAQAFRERHPEHFR
jgi:hypothetical protein